MQGTVRDSTLKSYIYTHITDNMQRSAADKIERGFGRNEGALGKNGQTPDQAPETPVRAKFEPKQPKIRRPGTGCIFRISEKKRQSANGYSRISMSPKNRCTPTMLTTD